MEKESTFSYIDNYCERISYNAEPANVITNIVFILVGILLIRKILSEGNFKLKNFDIISLSIVLICIGLGSAFYHYQPNELTLNLDVIPIAIFIHVFLISLLVRIFHLKFIGTIVFFLVFVASGIISEVYLDRDILNGTIMYVPTYITLLIIAGVLHYKKSPQAIYILKITLIWSLSLFFRTVDMELCEYTFGLGTHTLWHILNAVVLYKLVLLLFSGVKN